MSNENSVVKLGSVAAVAIGDSGHDDAKKHAGAGAQALAGAEVWRLFRGPGDNECVVCPTSDVGNRGWETMLGKRQWPTSSAEDGVHPLCIIIKPTGSGPVIGPITAGTMYLREGTSRKFQGVDKLSKELAKVNWKQDKQRWVARLPGDHWMIVEDS